MTRALSSRAANTVLLFVLIGSLFLVNEARAGNFGSTYAYGDPATNVNLGNNWTHTVSFHGVRSDIENATMTIIDNEYNPTDLDVWSKGTSRDTDVLLMDSNYGRNGLIGWVICPDGATTGGSFSRGWCYGQELRFNLSYDEWFDTSLERRHVACHELGHTVGLRHETGALYSCMRDDGTKYVVTTSHDDQHINDIYFPY